MSETTGTNPMHTFPETGPSSIILSADDGRTLVRIWSDGTVEMNLDDADEAARAFVDAVRRITGVDITQADR